MEEATIWYDKAWAEIQKQGNVDRQIAKEIYARRGNVMFEKAKRLFNSQKYEESLKMVENALAEHVTKDKLYLKADCYVQLLQPDKATQVYKDILKKDPKDYTANQYMNRYAA